MTENELEIVLESMSKNGMVVNFKQEDPTYYQFEVRNNPDDLSSTCIVYIALMDDNKVFVMSRVEDIGLIFNKESLSQLMDIYSPFSFARLGAKEDRLYSFFSIPLEYLTERMLELAFLEVGRHRTHILQTCGKM